MYKRTLVVECTVKENALDGTQYNLLLLDSERIDAYDQTASSFTVSR
ncbi:hypothetical protein NC651_006696 [Populus alba x Populus x berolinensis]|nr:hypothetical protein NC651_006696 [Populus alba x Populus x berolinensis]